MAKINQKELILKYMQDFGSITVAQGFTDLGITKVSTRISELRADGIEITDVTVKSKNRYGKPCQYKIYSLAEERKQ